MCGTLIHFYFQNFKIFALSEIDFGKINEAGDSFILIFPLFVRVIQYDLFKNHFFLLIWNTIFIIANSLSCSSNTYI